MEKMSWHKKKWQSWKAAPPLAWIYEVLVLKYRNISEDVFMHLHQYLIKPFMSRAVPGPRSCLKRFCRAVIEDRGDAQTDYYAHFELLHSQSFDQDNCQRFFGHYQISVMNSPGQTARGSMVADTQRGDRGIK